MKSKTPKAAKRTISMFTGKTDLESVAARDGTAPEPKEKVKKPAEWKPADGERRWVHPTHGELIKRSDGWWVRKKGQKQELGPYDSLLFATSVAGR